MPAAVGYQWVTLILLFSFIFSFYINNGKIIFTGNGIVGGQVWKGKIQNGSYRGLRLLLLF